MKRRQSGRWRGVFGATRGERPESMPRRAAAILVGLFGLLFPFQLILVASGQRGGESFSDNLLLAVPVFSAGIIAVAGGACGLIALVRGDRSPIVWGAVALGVIVISFAAGEVLVPH